MPTPPTTLAVGVRSFVLEQHFTFEYDVGVWPMGSVQVLKDRRSGVLKTCRSIFKPRLTNVWAASRELTKLKALQHPMLSSVTDVLEDSEYLFVVSLRANGGDLAEFLDRLGEEATLEEEICASYVAQVLVALAHCHAVGVYHHDLQLSNVLLTSREPEARVLLSDVGLIPALKGSGLETHPAAASSGPEPDLEAVARLACAVLLGSTQPANLEDDSWASSDLWEGRSEEAKEFVKFLRSGTTAASALHHPWLRNVLLRPSLSPENLEDDARERIACYATALLLIPIEMAQRDVESLLKELNAFDQDDDGLIALVSAQKILEKRGVRQAAAEAALAVADVRGTGVLDFSALAAAGFLADLARGSSTRFADIKGRLQEHFFEAYGDEEEEGHVLQSDLRSSVRNSVGEVLQVQGNVSFDELLSAFTEEEIDEEDLLPTLAKAAGIGTPNSLFDHGFMAQEESSWLLKILHTCGGGPRRRRVYSC
ncbi:CPK30 [Symbiodinium natans]|uniref:CPK30 protein n=1 Tax=Symbiodinium natans TaxID=878477 RepID=A0A812TG85_9DINO|nr:CPK30 [Symbiodinium natans]